jgi:hypothetical protein
MPIIPGQGIEGGFALGVVGAVALVLIDGKLPAGVILVLEMDEDVALG